MSCSGQQQGYVVQHPLSLEKLPLTAWLNRFSAILVDLGVHIGAFNR